MPSGLFGSVRVCDCRQQRVKLKLVHPATFQLRQRLIRGLGRGALVVEVAVCCLTLPLKQNLLILFKRHGGV
jgi:hypothetical protein